MREVLLFIVVSRKGGCHKAAAAAERKSGLVRGQKTGDDSSLFARPLERVRASCTSGSGRIRLVLMDEEDACAVSDGGSSSRSSSSGPTDDGGGRVAVAGAGNKTRT